MTSQHENVSNDETLHVRTEPEILIKKAGEALLSAANISFSMTKKGAVILKASNVQLLGTMLEEGDELHIMPPVTVIEREVGEPQKEDPIVSLAEGFEVDTAMTTLLLDGERVKLGTKEYAILMYLVENKNRVMHQRQIYSSIWDEELYHERSNTLRVQIGTLKKKLGRFSWMIQTKVRKGYVFIDDEELIAD